MSSAKTKPTVVVDRLSVSYRAYESGRAVRGGRRLLRKDRGVKRVKAVRKVSFAVYEGESVGIIGPNGSGKSTLLRATAGLIRPASGAVYASTRPALLGVNSVLIPDLTGEKNIVLGALALGMSREEIRERRDEIVEFSGLEEFIDYPMRTYSSGMSARLRFSVAVARHHSIMLVDEALAVGDKAFRERSERRMRQMIDEAGTVFLVSHSMESIRSTCKRAIWLDHGQIQMDGPADEVCAAYEQGR